MFGLEDELQGKIKELQQELVDASLREDELTEALQKAKSLDEEVTGGRSVAHFVQDFLERFIGQRTQYVDLEIKSWKAIKKAASESNWIPKGYFMNDWVSDVCDFLRNRKLKVVICTTTPKRCSIPENEFDPTICADLKRWDDMVGGPANCVGCPHCKEVDDEKP